MVTYETIRQWCLTFGTEYARRCCQVEASPGHCQVNSPRDLTEVIEDRAERASTLIASQLPLTDWHAPRSR